MKNKKAKAGGTRRKAKINKIGGEEIQRAVCSTVAGDDWCRFCLSSSSFFCFVMVVD